MSFIVTVVSHWRESVEIYLCLINVLSWKKTLCSFIINKVADVCSKNVYKMFKWLKCVKKGKEKLKISIDYFSWLPSAYKCL